MHSAQGALAGACLMQLGLGPWPNDDGTLVRPMAYASLAVPMTRAIHVLAVFAFVGVADLHVSNPRVLTGLVLWMYTLIVTTLVLEIPTVVAIVLRRAEVEEPLQAMLDAALNIFNSSNATVYNPPPFEPEPLLPTQEPGNGTDAIQLFSTGLTSQQLSFWTALIWVRALVSLLSWMIMTVVQSVPAFGVPPVPIEVRDESADRRGW